MFDFEKLEVYKKARSFNTLTNRFLESRSMDRFMKQQLQRASFSIILNIAEGSGRFTEKDKRNFYIIARGSVFECVAVFDSLYDSGLIAKNEFLTFYTKLDEISRMLFAIIKHHERKLV